MFFWKKIFKYLNELNLKRPVIVVIACSESLKSLSNLSHPYVTPIFLLIEPLRALFSNILAKSESRGGFYQAESLWSTSLMSRLVDFWFHSYFSIPEPKVRQHILGDSPQNQLVYDVQLIWTIPFLFCYFRHVCFRFIVSAVCADKEFPLSYSNNINP